jgi:hypothetical protein
MSRRPLPTLSLAHALYLYFSALTCVRMYDPRSAVHVSPHFVSPHLSDLIVIVVRVVWSVALCRLIPTLRTMAFARDCPIRTFRPVSSMPRTFTFLRSYTRIRRTEPCLSPWSNINAIGWGIEAQTQMEPVLEPVVSRQSSVVSRHRRSSQVNPCPI